MRTNLDTGDIEAFAVVASHLSYRVAADALAISPSSLSRRIAKLEEQLGVRLFERTTREVKLTLSGKEFLARAKDILLDLDELLTALRSETAPRSSIVSLACIPSVAALLLPEPIRRFNARNTRTRIRVFDLTTNGVLDAIEKGEADFGIVYFGAHKAGLESVSLIKDEFVVVGPRRHPLLARREVRWDDLDGERIIATWKGAGIRLHVDLELAKMNKNTRWFYEVQQIYTAVGFAEAGLGLAIVPSYFVPKVKGAKIATARLIEPTVPGGLNLVRMADRPLRGLAADLWNEIVKEAAV